MPPEAPQTRITYRSNDPLVKRYADLIWDAWMWGDDQRVRELYREIEPDAAFTTTVWAQFPSAMRANLKELLDRDL